MQNNPISTESINALNCRCYNANASYWDRLPFSNFLPEWILKGHHREIGMKAFDIGSGTGLLAEWLTNQGFDVLCIDPSEEMVRRCLQKGLKVLQTTIQNFSCTEKFDLIVAVLSLIHVPKSEIEEQLARIDSWLNPGGTFVLALIAGTGEGVGEHSSTYPRYFSYYSREEAIRLTKPLFRCVYESQVGGSISYLVFLFQKEMKNEKEGVQ